MNCLESLEGGRDVKCALIGSKTLNAFCARVRKNRTQNRMLGGGVAIIRPRPIGDDVIFKKKKKNRLY